MSGSTGTPALVLRRYFLSQMSWEAGCIGISRSPATSLESMVGATASRRTVLILSLAPSSCARLGRVVVVFGGRAGGNDDIGARMGTAACSLRIAALPPALGPFP